MAFTIGIFFFSLVGLIAFFAVKRVELRRGVVFFPIWRSRADLEATRLKGFGAILWADITKVPPAALRMARSAAHEAALGLAMFARMSEKGAHRLADLVSHKRGFERRETRSEFLRQVGERKNGELDATDTNGQNTYMPR